MHKREFEKYFRGSRKLLQAHKKVCDENESRIIRRKKQCTRKNVFDGRIAFRGSMWKTHAMDINKLQVDDC